MVTDTRLIPLTQGKFATVDAIDFEWLNQWKWYASKKVTRSGDRWYAKRGTYPDHKNIRMHLEIAKHAGWPDGIYDHKNRDGLLNTRQNLRLATPGQQVQNRCKFVGKSSHYKGVTFIKRLGKWRARISANGEAIDIGLFDTEIEAAAAYAAFAILLHGDFACFD